MTKYIFVILICFFAFILIVGTGDNIKTIIYQHKEKKKIRISGEFARNTKVRNFIKKMVIKYNFNVNYLNELFSNFYFQYEALIAIAPEYKKIYAKYIIKKKPKKKPIIKYRYKKSKWERYKEFKLTNRHVRKGVFFWRMHKKYLNKAFREYGIPPEYILGIIGIESFFGNNTGKYPAFDTLATLAFSKHRRSDFFLSELENFLLMAKSENFQIKKIKSSYAGALGLGQFMPSNFQPYSVDFDNDGVRDLWNPRDAIGSIANYFAKNGWKRGEPVAVRARFKGKRFRRLKTGYKTKYSIYGLKKLKITPRTKFDYKKSVSLIKLNKFKYDQLWMGTKNFYVITRYNHSGYYAMAVHLLAQKIKKKYMTFQK